MNWIFDKVIEYRSDLQYTIFFFIIFLCTISLTVVKQSSSIEKQRTSSRKSTSQPRSQKIRGMPVSLIRDVKASHQETLPEKKS